jgi:hypothetical protein
VRHFGGKINLLQFAASSTAMSTIDQICEQY